MSGMTLSVFGQYNLTGVELNINNVNALFRPIGHHFWDFQGQPKYFFPADSNTSTIFSQVLWVGGKDINDSLYVAAERFRQDGWDYYPGPLSFPNLEISEETTHIYDTIWVVELSEIETFIEQHNNPLYPNYQIPQSILGWPAHGDTELGQSYNLAPFIDINGDGIYNPNDGDYPEIRGDKCLFFIFNDYYADHTESGGLKMGLEIHGMAYAFNIQDDTAFNNTTFLHYEIINRSDKTFYNTYIGLFTDFDIGYAEDDYIGCDVDRGSFYAYNGDDFDDSLGGVCGYGDNPPAQSCTLLGGPYKDADEIDNPRFDEFGNQIVDESINGINFGDEIVDNERLGMTSFIYFNNGTGNPATQDPHSAIGHYNYLTRTWLDGTSLCYGGTGHISGGADEDTPAKFMFTGNPSSDTYSWGTNGVVQEAWSEETEGNAPADRRGLCASGPFTFLPGAKHEVDIAFVSGVAINVKSSSVDVMKQYIDIIRNGFVNNITPAGKPFIVSGLPKQYKVENIEVKIFPNPANSNLTVEINSNANTETSVKIMDVNGRVFVSESFNITNGQNRFVMDINTLSAGIYIVTVNNGIEKTNKKLVVLK